MLLYTPVKLFDERQRCKSIFEVGVAIVGEGGYFIIFLEGLVQYLAPPDKFLEGLYPR